MNKENMYQSEHFPVIYYDINGYLKLAKEKCVVTHSDYNLCNVINNGLLATEIIGVLNKQGEGYEFKTVNVDNRTRELHATRVKETKEEESYREWQDWDAMLEKAIEESKTTTEEIRLLRLLLLTREYVFGDMYGDNIKLATAEIKEGLRSTSVSGMSDRYSKLTDSERVYNFIIKELEGKNQVLRKIVEVYFMSHEDKISRSRVGDAINMLVFFGFKGVKFKASFNLEGEGVLIIK
jgi:hypothetical protein